MPSGTAVKSSCSTCTHTCDAPASKWAWTRSAVVFDVAAGHDGVDQTVAAAVGEVVLAETESHQVVHVVRRAQVDRHSLASRSRAPWHRSVSSTTICSGARIASGPRISRACAVCSTGTKYGCAPSARSADSSQHLRTECRERRSPDARRADGHEQRVVHLLEVLLS